MPTVCNFFDTLLSEIDFISRDFIFVVVPILAMAGLGISASESGTQTPLNIRDGRSTNITVNNYLLHNSRGVLVH